MRAARLHGIRDLRIESLDVPHPGARELVVRVEACGICPTDVRKYAIGTRDGYPLNPGHEWVGEVVEVGPDATEWSVGQRVCGDTYAGYAEYAVLSVDPGAWSNGALAIPADLDAVRATFVEPLADCVHAVRDQARVRTRVARVHRGRGPDGPADDGRRGRRRRRRHRGRAARRAARARRGVRSRPDGRRPGVGRGRSRQRGGDPHDRSRGPRRRPASVPSRRAVASSSSPASARRRTRRSTSMSSTIAR